MIVLQYLTECDEQTIKLNKIYFKLNAVEIPEFAAFEALPIKYIALKISYLYTKYISCLGIQSVNIVLLVV